MHYNTQFLEYLMKKIFFLLFFLFDLLLFLSLFLLLFKLSKFITSAFKQSFSSTGDIIDITGKSDIPCDYKANSYLINSKSPIIKFNHILNIVKFILI